MTHVELHTLRTPSSRGGRTVNSLSPASNHVSTMNPCNLGLRRRRSGLAKKEGVQQGSRTGDPTSSVALGDYERWSLTCGGTRWSTLVCDLRSAAAAAPCARRSSGRSWLRAGCPALPRCADVESGDKMIDRVLIPRLAFAVARSLGRPGRRALAAGSIREPTANIFMTTGGRAGCVRSSCGGDHLLVGRRISWRECLVAELAQDVVGASTKLARDR
jgi:hypothetical protein